MIQKAKKKTSFLISVLITGILGTVGGYLSANYSKNSSFFAPIAKADVPASSGFGGSVGDGDSGGGGGGGGGGDCSDGSD